MRAALALAIWALAAAAALAPSDASAQEYIVYSVYRPLDLGIPGELPQKDFYVNMGANQGISRGTVLEVVRRVPTYDLTTQKLYKDAAFPIARLKVIHVEAQLAIARLEGMLPPDKTPAILPRAVMVGDVVRRPESP